MKSDISVGVGLIAPVFVRIPRSHITARRFEVQSGAYGVTSAARGGEARATAAARQALADQGLPADAPLTVTVTCTPYPGDCNSGTSVITVRVSSRVDLLVPDLLGGGRPTFALDATHSVPIGQYQEIEP